MTHDADFLRLAKADSEHPGVAYCHQQARTIGEIIDMLILLHAVAMPKQMRGRVEYL